MRRRRDSRGKPPHNDDDRGRRHAPALRAQRTNGGILRFAQNDSNDQRSLLSPWWMQLIVAGWTLFVVVTYFRLQLTRLIEIAQR